MIFIQNIWFKWLISIKYSKLITIERKWMLVDFYKLITMKNQKVAD